MLRIFHKSQTWQWPSRRRSTKKDVVQRLPAKFVAMENPPFVDGFHIIRKSAGYVSRKSASHVQPFHTLVTLQECGISSISGEQQDAHEALVKLLEAVYVGLGNLSWKICWLQVVHAWKQVAKLQESNVPSPVRSIIWVFFINSIKKDFSLDDSHSDC